MQRLSFVVIGTKGRREAMPESTDSETNVTPVSDAEAESAIDKTLEERPAQRLKALQDGPYYIAPDSAEPLPDGIWARVDLEAIAETTERINEILVSMPKVRGHESLASSVYFIPDDRRAYLERIGGEVTLESIKKLDDLAHSGEGRRRVVVGKRD